LLVVALALYRHHSIGEGVGDLDLALRDAQILFVSKSAVAHARKKFRALPEVGQARVTTVSNQLARKRVLLISLFDSKRYKAADIAACYRRRWQIETSYRELKQTIPGMALMLRSRAVDGGY
jgi:hypothetical protein